MLLEEIYKEHKAIQEDEQKEMLGYLKQMKQQKGSIYENDFYTRLIATLLQRWKDVDIDGTTQELPENGNLEKAKKQNVLIIDDLDRIDPQHAFRLFNVFGAHFDLHEEQKNKFGFDKVVFVCDIRNIRSIFAHNYGSEVDFSGYIDKFFSTQVYQFDNIDAVVKIVKTAIKEADYLERAFARFPDMWDSELEFMLSTLLQARALNLRSLFKLSINNQINYHSKKYDLDSVPVQSDCFLAVVIADVLVQLVGSPQALYGAFKRCERYTRENKTYLKKYNMWSFLGDVVAFLGYKRVNS